MGKRMRNKERKRRNGAGKVMVKKKQRGRNKFTVLFTFLGGKDLLFGLGRWFPWLALAGLLRGRVGSLPLSDTFSC